jgi:hypothetical protein
VKSISKNSCALPIVCIFNNTSGIRIIKTNEIVEKNDIKRFWNSNVSQVFKYLSLAFKNHKGKGSMRKDEKSKMNMK